MSDHTASPTEFINPSICLKECQQEQHTPIAFGKKSVQFGELSAAEFEKDEPPSSAMKHLLPADARRRFYSHHDDVCSEIDRDPDIERTKANSRILAMWESDFDDVLDSATKRRRSSGTFIPMRMSPNQALDVAQDDLHLDVDNVP